MEPFMRILLVVQVLMASLISSPLHAGDAVAECEAFFAKFQNCVDGLKGEQQDEARIFLKTLRGTLGMADGINRGDPTLMSMMCGMTMKETKKDPDVQKYNCSW
jgi:hypothetical protein